ncbi:LicD family protein [Peptoclostridium acidaminophilum DSM 3953]|uniref:LicD family protein n=1 Tax=Peptoclostridium acidaminophilum DSM 3953 TaxID=1286171 RepID=W8T8T2_PEPAC|nr:LicD family protein [Peptoclostridium acidaminophilum]AHM57290.1 LicD family protein [Peptoclostridium acidaminophilum DSM 3953]
MKKLRKVQLAELLILNEIARICDLNNIKYYLVGGTLLGAIRHSGFIPWDDDLDIAMERKDYDRFCSICKDQLHKDFYLQNHVTDKNFNMYISKVRLKDTLLVDKRVKNLKMHQGIYVDIFPLDYSKKNTGTSLKIRASLIKVFFWIKVVKLKNAQPNIFIKRLLKIPATIIAHFIPLALIDFLTNSLMTSEDEKAHYLVNFCSQYGYRKQTMNKHIYGDPIKVKFENNYYSAPAQYDFYLTRIYNNYMELPPRDKRRTIHEFVDVDLGKYRNIDIINEKIVY